MANEEIMVSPHFTLAQLTSGEVKPVEVFKDKVQTCVLDFAKKCLEDQHSGIVVLMLCCSVFEPIGQMLPRARIKHLKHEAAFCKGCAYALGSEIATQDVSLRLFRLLRGGLYHDGWIKPELVLWRGEGPVQDVNGTLRINPEKFYYATHAGVNRYIDKLNEDDEIRRAFDAYHPGMSVEQIAITAIPDEAGITVCPR